MADKKEETSAEVPKKEEEKKLDSPQPEPQKEEKLAAESVKEAVEKAPDGEVIQNVNPGN